MSAFVGIDDYKVSIKVDRMLQMIEEDITLLDEAEATAIAFVKDALFQKYDIASIFATSADNATIVTDSQGNALVDNAGNAITSATYDNRPLTVVRWVKCLSLYYLHERLPERLIPKRVIEDYEMTQKTLFDIADGKRSTNLPLLDTDGDGNTNSKFRWGSRTARSH